MTTRFYIDDPAEDFEVWVEGIGAGDTTISLTWHDTSANLAGVFDTVKVVVVAIPHPILDIDTDSDNTGAVDRTLSEDNVEDGSGPGKKLFIKASTASEVVLDANIAAVDGLSAGYQLVLIVSPGLNLWADSGKSARVTSANSATIPADDSLGETYIWTSAWTGTTTVYAEGTREGTPKIHWRVLDATGAIIARDAVKFTVVLQNVIFVGVDGTGQNVWLTGPHARTAGLPERWNSHTRNLYDDLSSMVSYSHYDYGPKNQKTGSDSDDIHDQLLNSVRTEYLAAPDDDKPKIALLGWSRGAMIALWIANDLAGEGIPVEFVGLYDPVDMSLQIPDIESRVRNGITRLAIIGPTPEVNIDYPLFLRMALADDYGYRIRPEPGMDGRIANTSTLISRFWLDASHGGIGGTPGFNDIGIRFWGEDWNTDYSYSSDRANSMTADEIIRMQLLAVGIDVPLVNNYGFPLSNPTNTASKAPGGDTDDK